MFIMIKANAKIILMLLGDHDGKAVPIPTIADRVDLDRVTVIEHIKSMRLSGLIWTERPVQRGPYIFHLTEAGRRALNDERV